VYAGFSTRYPLTSGGRVYLQAHGSYRWVDSVDASAGIVDTEIDVSSWEGGLGIGVLLD